MKLKFALNTCTKLEEIKRSNTTEAWFSQVNRGAEAFFCIYESKSHRAQSSVQISINDSRRCKSYERYFSGIAAKIGDRSCSPALISINAEKTQPVKKNKQQETRQNHLKFLFVELLNC